MEIYELLVVIESVISLFMCLLIIFAYMRFKRVETFAFKLVMMLCVADGFNSIGYMLVVVGDFTTHNWLCQASGFLNQFSNMSSFIITALIAYTVLVTVVYNNRKVEMKAIFFYLLGFVLPAIVAAIPTSMNEFKPITTFFCWMDQSDQTGYLIFGIGSYFGLLWLSVIFFIYCLCRVQRYLKGYVGLDRATAVSYKKLLQFPIILMICWLPATIDRVVTWFSGDDFQHKPWMNFMHVSFDMLATVLNVVVFGFNEQVRKEFRRFVFSNQSVQNYKDLDEEDRMKKVVQNPVLQKLNHPQQMGYNPHASMVSNTPSQLNQVSDIAFFMNEDDEQFGYKNRPSKIPGIHHHHSDNNKTSNYSNYSEDQ